MNEKERQFAKMDAIAERIVLIESRDPGSIMLIPNMALIPHVAARLKERGFKKPFLQNDKQFVFDCYLSYHKAALSLSKFVLISSGADSQGHFHIWDCLGRYCGWQGALQRMDFNASGKENIVLIVDCNRCIDRMEDLLEPIT